MSQAADMQPKGAGGLIAPLASIIISRQMHGDNRRVKQLLEGALAQTGPLGSASRA